MKILTETQKLALIQEKLRFELGSFGLSFVPNDTKASHSELTGNTTTFFFTNQNSVGPNACILFTGTNELYSDCFDFIVIRNSDKSRLSLEDYLVSHLKMSSMKSRFSLSSYKGSFEDQLDQFFDFLKKTLNAEFKAILEGREWIEIPFDWGEYK